MWRYQRLSGLPIASYDISIGIRFTQESRDCNPDCEVNVCISNEALRTFFVKDAEHPYVRRAICWIRGLPSRREIGFWEASATLRRI